MPPPPPWFSACHMIIGLTGKNGAGKGVVAEILQKRDFEYRSLSDVIRDAIRAEGHKVTRERLIEMGRRLRREGGPSVLAEKILKTLEPGKKYIIDSIRNPHEVLALRQKKDFHLIFVDAEQKVRFERCKSRGRENDPHDFAEFVRLEEAELHSTDVAGQQLVATAALADHILDNSGTLEELETSLDELLINLSV